MIGVMAARTHDLILKKIVFYGLIFVNDFAPLCRIIPFPSDPKH
jgi:hypothetical protein